MPRLACFLPRNNNHIPQCSARDLRDGLAESYSVTPDIATPDGASIVGAGEASAAVALDRGTTDSLADVVVETKAGMGRAAGASLADCRGGHRGEARKK